MSATLSSAVKRTIRELLDPLGIGITSSDRLRRLIDQSRLAGDHARLLADIDFILALPENQASRLLRSLPNSTSQLRQDLFVLSTLCFKQNGFFVEFGAADGVVSSNTYLLEKDHDWTGILAEPARIWHKRLRENRSSLIETDCVWRNSGSTLSFNEVQTAEHSTIESFNSSDMHRQLRQHGTTYSVKTISLVDLLRKHSAPPIIDYLSIDTEGSEYDILSSFDFSSYRFRVITCEHNFMPAREQILALLTRNGYSRTLTKFSQYDDWYFDAELSS